MPPRRFRNASGPLIRKTRDARGWTQDELAAKLQLAGLLHFDRVAVAKVESQIRSLLDYELAVFAEVLEVEVAELLPSFNSVKRDLEALVKGHRDWAFCGRGDTQRWRAEDFEKGTHPLLREGQPPCPTRPRH